MDMWKAWLLESMPIHLIIPLLLVLSGTWYFGDMLYDRVQDSKEIIVEVLEDVSHFDLLHSDDDAVEETPLVEVVYTVDKDVTRVMRI